jgi:phage gpG-like protein
MSNLYPNSDKLQSLLPAAFQKLASFARVRIGRDAVQKYMRDVGFAGVGTRRSSADTGPLRRVTGRLSRSITGARSAGQDESIFNVDIKGASATIEGGSSVPYAATHEGGFAGNVVVPPHTRTITQAFGRPIAPRSVSVRSFTRFQNVPARPYLGPAVDDNMAVIQAHLSNLLLEAYNESHVRRP